MKLPTPRWDIGTVLYLRVAAEEGGMLTGYVIRPGGVMSYLITWGDGDEKTHWEVELTSEKVYAGGGETEEG